MDQIIMKGLKFYGYHGVLEAEKALGQLFTVYVTVDLDLKEAGETDDLNHTVSYAKLYEIVNEQVTKKSYNLIEALAENIAISILKNAQAIQKVSVEIEKPEAPIAGIFDSFGVKITRKKL